MYDYLSIGCVPHDEKCLGVNHPHERAECLAFMKQIEKHYPAPWGARLRVKAFDHDFGAYHEVVAYYDDDNDEAEKWAFAIEADAKQVLSRWEDEFRPNYKEWETENA
jgi:hypothetical protein